MKAKLNNDGTVTVNSIKGKELGTIAVQVVKGINAEKARQVYEELGVEFDLDAIVGAKMVAIIKKMGEGDV